VPTITAQNRIGSFANVWWTRVAHPTRLTQTDARERLLGLGINPVGNYEEEFAAQWRADLAKYEAVVKATGIKAE
jgi:tripartite-type tricarboxylate transporter receptor subunit TctC